MVLGIIAGLAGLVFLVWGILYNEKMHKEEGLWSFLGQGDLSIAFLILAIILFPILWIVDKLPYWVAKILILIIAIGCFYVSYLLFTNPI